MAPARHRLGGRRDERPEGVRWSGIGTAAIAIIGVVFFRETLGWAGIAGITLIVLGVVVLNLSGAHT